MTARAGRMYQPIATNRVRSSSMNRPPARPARSVYLQQHRTQIASLLEVFDAPSIVTTCTRRLPSTIPLQSLSLMNSDFVVTRAQELATRLERECRSAKAIDARIDRGLPAHHRPRRPTAG